MKKHGTTLSVPERHQLNIARKTMKMSDEGAFIMGGMTKAEAEDIIRTVNTRGRRAPAYRHNGSGVGWM